jgi:ribosomal protein S12 methylthiotransferase
MIATHRGSRLSLHHPASLGQALRGCCNHRCSFCIIPSMRGDLASRPAGEVLLEAERLMKAGDWADVTIAGSSATTSLQRLRFEPEADSARAWIPAHIWKRA